MDDLKQDPCRCITRCSGSGRCYGTTTMTKIGDTRKLSRSEKYFILSVMVPALALFVVFTLIPVILSFVISFSQWQMMGAPDWVGLANYKELLFGDPTFWLAMRATIYFTLMYVPCMMVVPLGMAVLIDRPT